MRFFHVVLSRRLMVAGLVAAFLIVGGCLLLIAGELARRESKRKYGELARRLNEDSGFALFPGPSGIGGPQPCQRDRDRLRSGLRSAYQFDCRLIDGHGAVPPAVRLARQRHLRTGRKGFEHLAFFQHGRGDLLLFFIQLGDAFGTACPLKLRQALGAILIHRVVLKLLLMSTCPDHHGSGHDPA